MSTVIDTPAGRLSMWPRQLNNTNRKIQAKACAPAMATRIWCDDWAMKGLLLEDDQTIDRVGIMDAERMLANAEGALRAYPTLDPDADSVERWAVELKRLQDRVNRARQKELGMLANHYATRLLHDDQRHAEMLEEDAAYRRSYLRELSAFARRVRAARKGLRPIARRIASQLTKRAKALRAAL